MKTIGILNDRNILDHMITISELGRGKASTIVNKLTKDGNPWFITKNSKPEAVIVKIDDYQKLLKMQEEFLEMQEDIELLIEAQKRLNAKNEENYTSHEDVMKEFGITKEDLKGVEVEFE